MKLGIIGLGNMGGNMARRLIENNHQVVGHDRSAEAIAGLTGKGFFGADSIDQLLSVLDSGSDAPRVIWLMIPAGAPVDQTLETLTPQLTAGDIIIDGGNSNYRDSIRRSEKLDASGINFVDAGTSGGIWGLQQGYCLMIGGKAAVVEYLRPIFEALAPTPTSGWGHVGPAGAGHYAKMIHNGIEYGMMQAYAEGFAILGAKKDFAFDLGQISEIWQHGSVIRSWLLDLTADALREDPQLEGIAGYVADSGEGRWTVNEAVELAVPAPVISQSLFQRFASRHDDLFSDKLLAAMRHKFGGHAIKRSS